MHDHGCQPRRLQEEQIVAFETDIKKKGRGSAGQDQCRRHPCRHCGALGETRFLAPVGLPKARGNNLAPQEAETEEHDERKHHDRRQLDQS